MLSGLDVLFYTMENDDKIVVRPSGTEPKIKMYLLCHGDDAGSLARKIDAYAADVRTFAD